MMPNNIPPEKMELQGRPKYFAGLAPEIRKMIWEAAARLPRVVVVVLESNHLLTTRTTPILLHICRESRYYGLKAYTFDLGRDPEPGVTVPAKIWINPHIDCVAFRYARALSDDMWRPELFHGLRRSIGDQAFSQIHHFMRLYSGDFTLDWPQLFIHPFSCDVFTYMKSITFSWRNWEAMSCTGHDEIPAKSQHWSESEQHIKKQLEVIETWLCQRPHELLLFGAASTGVPWSCPAFDIIPPHAVSEGSREAIVIRCL
jgi:hypothetical protein